MLSSLPTATENKEPRVTSRSRFALYLLLIPVFSVAGWYGMSRSSDTLAGINPVVSLAREIRAEQSGRKAATLAGGSNLQRVGEIYK